MRRSLMRKGSEERFIDQLYAEPNYFNSLGIDGVMLKIKGTRNEQDEDVVVDAYEAIKINSKSFPMGLTGSYFGTVLSFLDMLRVQDISRDAFREYAGDIISLLSGDSQKINLAMSKMKRVQLLDELNLVTDKSCNIIFSGQSVDRQCRIRAASLKRNISPVDMDEKQIRWGDVCFAIEERICDMLLQKKPLADIFEFTRLARKAIAVFEGYYSDEKKFGELLRRGVLDRYGSNPQINSLVDPNTFNKMHAMLSEHLEDKPDRVILHKTYQDEKGYHVKHYHIHSLSSNPDKIVLEQEIQMLEHASRPEDRFITSLFNNHRMQDMFTSLDLTKVDGRRVFVFENAVRMNKSLSEIDERYLKILREEKEIESAKGDMSESGDADFLLHLGRFAYQLVRLYPLERGSAGVNQQILRGVCQYYFHPQSIDIPDIILGEGIPYDIYAQFTFKEEQYAEVFRETLLPIFKQAREVVKGSALEKHSMFAVNAVAPAAASSSPSPSASPSKSESDH